MFTVHVFVEQSIPFFTPIWQIDQDQHSITYLIYSVLLCCCCILAKGTFFTHPLIIIHFVMGYNVIIIDNVDFCIFRSAFSELEAISQGANFVHVGEDCFMRNWGVYIYIYIYTDT